MKRFSFEWRRAVLWLAVPALIIAVVAGRLAYQETSAAIEYRNVVNMLRQQSQPVSNADLATRHEQMTSSEGTPEWDRIAALTSAISKSQTADLPFFRGNVPLPVIAPGESWEKQDEVGEFLEMAEPVFDLIEQAADKPAPVWLPIHFEGTDTLVAPDYWGAETDCLLMLDIEYALWTNDMPRALRSIVLLLNVQEALDFKSFSISTSVKNRRLQACYSMIRRSFAHGGWTQDQLEKLSELVREPVSIEDWPERVAGDTGALIASLESPGTYPALSEKSAAFVARLPSNKLRAVNLMLQLRDVPTDNFQDFHNAVSRLCTSTDAREIEAFNASTQFQWQAGLALSLLSLEDDRRLIEAAIAIKRFQLETGAFPESLAELEQPVQLLNGQEPYYQRDGDSASLSQSATTDEANEAGRYLDPNELPIVIR